MIANSLALTLVLPLIMAPTIGSDARLGLRPPLSTSGSAITASAQQDDRQAKPGPCRRASGRAASGVCSRAPDGQVPPLARIAAARVTGAVKDFGPSGQILYPPAGTSGNVHALQCMDCLLLQADDGVPRTISDVVVDRSRTGLTTQTKHGPYPATGPWILQRFSFTSRKRGIYIRGQSHDITIRDGVIRGSGINTSHGDIPVGIGINGGHDITIARVEVSGFQSDDGSRYPNADGISCERIDANITIRDAFLHDNTDGGLDCKATNVTLDRVTSARNRYGFRLWGSGRAGALTAEGNRNAAVQIKATTQWTIDRLNLIGPAGSHGDVEVNEPGGHLSIASCSRPITVNGEGGQITLGPSCR